MFRVTALLPKALRLRALLGTAQTIIDLAGPVDPERDHVRGPDRAPVTTSSTATRMPVLRPAEPVVRELLAGYGDLRYVWRHLPLTDVHPHAQLAAEAAEAAAEQGKFWEMHDHLLRQGRADGQRPDPHAGETGLDTGSPPRPALPGRPAQVVSDIDSADLSGVSGTPTFFINGNRHHGAYDIDTLSAAVRNSPGPDPHQLPQQAPAHVLTTRPSRRVPGSARCRTSCQAQASKAVARQLADTCGIQSSDHRCVPSQTCPSHSCWTNLDSESAGGTSAVWRLIVRRSGDRCSKAEPFPRSSGVACSA